MCDTFVILPDKTTDGSVIFGKNSDREPNEAQALEYYPPQSHSPDETLRCTYMTIPQARETRGVLLSRPFWMWGAEMGANEKGVVIGNEAVWTRMPLNKGPGLTGMDLLRLALERSDTAEQALEVMVQLLADHGQGGICGYEDKTMAYHNSFIIADPGTAWVLETAGHLWAALKVTSHYAISNRLTITETMDRVHPDLIATAQKHKWLKKWEDFNFAQCYSDTLYSFFSRARLRRTQADACLSRPSPPTDVQDAMDILRSHRTVPYSPDAHWFGDSICAHAGNAVFRNATQTTGSLVAHLSADRHTFWATGTSSPCIGMFKPIWFTDTPLPDLGAAPFGRYDADALWWRHERLHRLVLMDYAPRSQVVKQLKKEVETTAIQKAAAFSGPPSDITASAFSMDRDATHQCIELVSQIPVREKNGFIFRGYWKRQNAKAGMPL